MFAVFLASNKRKVFLEVKNGKYINPLKKDFLALDEIYNRDNFIKAGKKRNSIKDFAFGVSLSFLSVLCLTQLSDRIDLDRQAHIVYSTDYFVDEVEELEQKFEISNVSLEEVIRNIDNNEKLDNKYKPYMKKFAIIMNYFCPDFDLGVYAENAKDIEFVVTSSEDIKNAVGKNASAYYNYAKNKIYLTEDAIDSTIYHEIAHSAHSIKVEKNGKRYYRSWGYGDALDEAMNVVVTRFLAPKENTYFSERVFLEYFLKYVDYDVVDYNKYGISYLIDSMADKYKEADIVDVAYTLDAIHDADINGIEIDDEAYNTILEELFLVCLDNIDVDAEDFYKPFRDFAKIFTILNDSDEIYKSYLEKYNQRLEELGINNIITYEEVSKKLETLNGCEEVGINDDEVCLLKFGEAKFIDVRTGEELADEKRFRRLVKIKPIYNQIMALSPLEFDSDEYWLELIKTFDLAWTQDYRKIDITYEGEVLDTCYLEDCHLFLTENEDGKIGLLFKHGDKILYQSHNNIKRVLEFIEIDDYFNLGSVDSLELSPYLCEDYLKIFALFDYHCNLTLEDDEVKYIGDRENIHKFLTCKENANYVTDDIYGPFRNFIKVYGIYDFDLKYWLNEYNEVLKKRGVQNIITYEEVAERFDVYLEQVGFLCEENRLIPVIYEDGKYKALYSKNYMEAVSADDVVWTDGIGKCNFGLGFLYYDIFGTSEYWVKLAQEYSLKPAYYRSINIYDNEVQVCNAYIKNFDIYFVVNDLGEYGYLIKDNNQIIYCSLEDYTWTRYLGKLIDFVNNKDTFYLESITEFIQVNVRYNDIIISEDGAQILPDYVVAINSENEVVSGHLRDMFVMEDLNGNMALYPFRLKLDIDYYYSTISLIDVFNYAQVLDQDKIEYTFTLEEIEELVRTYIGSLQLKRQY